MSEVIIPESDPVLKDFSPLVLSSGTVIRYQDGEVIYSRPDGMVEILRESGSLCGVGLFETNIDDVFIDCCGWYDHAWKSRKWFEDRCWDRESIDDYFLGLMLYVSEQQLDAVYRFRCMMKAHEYHFLVRGFGSLVYYKHPAGECLPTIAKAQWKNPIELAMVQFFEGNPVAFLPKGSHPWFREYLEYKGAF